MQKTTVYLPDDLKRSIERVAEQSQRSEADVIRTALTDYTSRIRPKPRAGLFNHGSLADQVDELLEGFGED